MQARRAHGARRVSLGYATDRRDDVARARSGAGPRRGFKSVIDDVAVGTHAVRAYALNCFKGGRVKNTTGDEHRDTRAQILADL